MRAVLERHPASPGAAVRGIEVLLTRERAVTVRYVLDADLARLRVPSWQGVHAGERLWQHTCFEIFVAKPGDPAYDELNFAPSGAWAAYAFEGYRQRAPAGGAPLDPRISVQRSADRLELTVGIALDRLSPAYARAPLEVGLSAVIEDEAGRLSYWALGHPGPKPDFHDREAFRVRLQGG